MLRNNDNRFDIDLKYGKIGEKTLVDIFSCAKIEIKSDRLFEKTGNIYIEYKSRGKKSGISVSEADWYLFWLGKNMDMALIIKTPILKSKLRNLIKHRIAKIKRGGDDLTSEGVIVKPSNLI